MNFLDSVKAIGVALLIMALNVAAAFGVMWVYGTFLETGHDPAFYEAAAQRIAPWSSIFAGAVICFVAMWWIAWRRAGRNGYAFAAVTVLIYTAIDVSIIAMAGALTAMSAIVAASITGKLAGALAGAWLSRPRGA
jgi:sorbitol-specific phosphotransferase system component IIC